MLGFLVLVTLQVCLMGAEKVSKDRLEPADDGGGKLRILVGEP